MMRGQNMLRAEMMAVGAALGLVACGQAPVAQDPVKRGEYLVAIAACGDCHTPGALLGQPQMDKVFSGGTVGFQMPTGTYYPPNLTPDTETGLGNWSEADIVKAIRTGARPDGRQLAPVMPYHWYAKLTDEDATAMAKYLKSLSPIANKVPGPFGPNETPTAPYSPVIVPQPATTDGQPATPTQPTTPQ